MKINATAFLAGIVFALGLAIGGMTQPAKIVGFLDVAGAWDLSLAFVMGGGVIVYALAYQVATRRTRPLFAPAFLIPTRSDLDGPLLAGAALFGIGWGIGGFCPGPAIVALAWLGTPVLIFIGAMCFGMLLHGWATTLSPSHERVPQSAITADS